MTVVYSYTIYRVISCQVDELSFIMRFAYSILNFVLIFIAGISQSLQYCTPHQLFIDQLKLQKIPIDSAVFFGVSIAVW